MKTAAMVFFCALTCSLAQTNLYTFTNRQGVSYENVRLQKFDESSFIYRGQDGGVGKIRIVDMPDDIQRKLGYNPVESAQRESVKAAEAAQRDFDKAVATGLFREVGGVIYDLRKTQQGWVQFSNVKVFQVLGDEDAALIDPHPERPSPEVIHVKRLGIRSDTERFGFWAMSVGSYTYINKRGDERIVRSYDVGRPCGIDEIPDTLRKGELASASIGIRSPTGRISRSASSLKTEEPVSSGSGFFITEDGYLITNEHVVRGAKKVRVRIKKIVQDAEIVRSSKTLDLAVLKTQGRFKPLALDFDRNVKLGDPVFTIGFPNSDVQGTAPKYTDGKISSLSGMEDDPTQFQISVPVQPGNSGGALVATNGVVVGIVRGKLNDLAFLAASGSVPQNVNYAVKAKYVRDLLEPIPGVLGTIKQPSSNGMVDNSIQTAEDATVMVLVY
jgi:S1-C subfamily serine protease